MKARGRKTIHRLTGKEKTLKVLSYNIHKGFGLGNIRYVLVPIKRAIQTFSADLVFLQEVMGHHSSRAKKVKGWRPSSQFEYLAGRIWPHFVYGKNAVYTDGHHGNAILSRLPFQSWENIDISTVRYTKRGLLHGIIQTHNPKKPLHVICLHLDLLQSGRRIQTRLLASRINRHVPKNHPLIIAGDFNDWSTRAGEQLQEMVYLKEAFLEYTGNHARTFPAKLPTLKLDRIYYRNLRLKRAKILVGKPWNKLSDHLALTAEFALP